MSRNPFPGVTNPRLTRKSMMTRQQLGLYSVVVRTTCGKAGTGGNDAALTPRPCHWLNDDAAERRSRTKRSPACVLCTVLSSSLRMR